MKIGLVQVTSPGDEQPDARRARVARSISELPDVDLIVLPELWAAGYFAFDDYPDRAETLDGPTAQLARTVATSRGCFVHAGSIVERDADRLFNTALLVGPDGQIALTYKKIHVFGYRSREAQLLTAGTDLAVLETAEFGTVGTTTCYDLRFPELWRDLVDLGAGIVVVPAAWPAARREHWKLFTSCRAVEEQVFVVGCNASGVQAGGVELAGCSRVVDPWGTVLYEAGADETAAVVEIDVSEVERVRREFPVLADRRRRRSDIAGAYRGSLAGAGAAGASI